jgi:hypothetical protein
MVDGDRIHELARRAYGHRERDESEPDTATLTAARAELRAAFVEIASRYSKDVQVQDTGDSYLRVEAKLKKGKSLWLQVGGEGHAWVEVTAGTMVIFDSMGFDEVSPAEWKKVERAMRS